MVSRDIFSIVFICTGNRCRSPYAAKRAEALTESLPVEIASAGTLDSPGHRSPPELVEIATGRRLELGAHRAVPMAAGSLEESDLVLGFSFSHVAAAVVDGGAPRAKTFTLPEFVRLLNATHNEVTQKDPVERARELVRRAHVARDGQGPSREEVRDPFGGPASDYEEMANEIDMLLKTLVENLFGTSTSPE